MNFKTTELTLRELILIESFARARDFGQTDYVSVMELVLSRAEPGQTSIQALLDMSASQATDLLRDALKSAAQFVLDRNRRDNVALSPDEKERLERLMQQMRDRNA